MPFPNPDTQFKPGHSGNPGGKPKTPIKDHVREKFAKMTPKEKDEFLSKIAPDIQWKMGEGNPAQESDITSGGEKINTLTDNPAIQELANKLYELDEANIRGDKPSDGVDPKPLDS